MIPPSPVVRPSRSRQRRWLLGVGVAAGALALGLVTVPFWAESMVGEIVRRTVERRLGLPVAIDVVRLRYDGLVLEGIRVGEAQGPRAVVDRLEAELRPPTLARWVRVRSLEVAGGRVSGSLEAWESHLLSAKTADPQPPTEVTQKGSYDGPDRVVVEALEVAIEASPRSHGLALRARVGFELALGAASPKVRLQLSSLAIEGPGGLASSVERVDAEGDLEMSTGLPRPRFPFTVRVRGGQLPLSPAIALSGIDGTVTLESAALERAAIDLAGVFSEPDGRAATPAAAKLWSISGTASRDLREGDVAVRVRSFELRRVPDILEHLPVVDSEGATLGGDLAVSLREGRASLRGTLALAGVNVRHPLLSSLVVHDFGVEAVFDAEVDPATRKLTVHSSRATRGEVAVELSGELTVTPERSGRAKLAIRLPRVKCQALLAAIPRELVPSLQGFALDGSMEASLALEIDREHLDALVLDGAVGIDGCGVIAAPYAVSADRLLAPFVHKITMRDGSVRSMRLMRGSGNYTPLDQMSPHVASAVLSTEDAGFFRHRGFLPSQFREALRRNLEAGRVRYGASTISMQMVKNVLLSHERTLSRKLQELFLTWYVERTLSKERILEIYLNVVELAPGIYGVTRGAQHYFAKDPAALNPVEAAYLALMLPSPVRRHQDYCRGELGPVLDAKVRRVLAIMHARGWLNDLDYAAWKATPLVFDPAERGSEAQCLAEVDRLLRAAGGQHAVTGLASSGAADAGHLLDVELDDLEDLTIESEGDASKGAPVEAQLDAPGRPAMDAIEPPTAVKHEPKRP